MSTPESDTLFAVAYNAILENVPRWNLCKLTIPEHIKRDMELEPYIDIPQLFSWLERDSGGCQNFFSFDALLLYGDAYLKVLNTNFWPSKQLGKLPDSLRRQLIALSKMSPEVREILCDTGNPELSFVQPLFQSDIHFLVLYLGDLFDNARKPK